MASTEQLERYRALPYKRRVDRVTDEKEGTYFLCSYPELPGLAADGETRAEAVKNAQEAFDDYVLARLHWGDPIPEPEEAKRVGRVLAQAEEATTRQIEFFFEFEEPPEVVFSKKVKKVKKKETLTRTTLSSGESTINQEAVASSA